MQAYRHSESVNKRLLMSDAPLLVADLEMTGLNVAHNQIVSIGWVIIDGLHIVHDSARHFYINNLDVNLDESAPIHKISHQELTTGVSHDLALQIFLEALAGRVLVLHHAPIDMRFLDALCLTLYGVTLRTQIIDTMDIERRRLSLRGVMETSSLRLNDCRDRYNLPQYQAHNAVVDAHATAELLLAQVAYGGQGRRLADYAR